MSPVRFSFLALLLTGAIVAMSGSVAQAEFGILPESFKSGTCNSPTPCAVPATQAASHPGITFTTFTYNFNGGGVPEGTPKDAKIDAPPGLIIDPQAVPTCSDELFEAETCPAPSQMGVVSLKLGNVGASSQVLPIFNMVPPTGAPADFAFRLGGHRVDIEGGVSWGGDYHQTQTIRNFPQSPPLASYTQIFFSAPNSVFVTIPTSCTGPPTTRLETDSYENPGALQHYAFSPVPPASPVTLETTGCNNVPFAPEFKVTPETTQSDAADGTQVEIKVPQDSNPLHLASAHLHVSRVVLPEGLTINPSAAHGLEACTEAQLGVGTTNPTLCPEGAKIGTVAVETPLLPPGSLVGNIYLGKPATGPITGPPYTIFLNAESPRFGAGLRLVGSVAPDETTGRLTATFAENPQTPFSSLALRFNGAPLAPLANPLACGEAQTTASLTPWSGQPPAQLVSAFTVDGNGQGGACPSPLPFALSQSTAITPANAGAKSSFTLNLARADGQQYLSRVSATLPPGLVGLIPSVPLCGEPQAAQGTCSAASEIGTATVQVGAGVTPTQFSGPVYLTGPVGNAPYGMSIAVPATTGPFALGTVVTRTGIEINPYTARVTVAGNVPTIVKGIPLRLRNLSIAISRQGFLINPTNCGVLATETVLGSTLGASQSLSTPFQVGNCNALGFKPKFAAFANGNTSKKNGAGLRVTIGYPSGSQANLRSTTVQLPKQLPSRLTTLQRACPEATFNASPWNCPANTRVGGATVFTPVLPSKLTGPAFFVSHGGAAFPDLDLVVTGNGVETILVGNTHISKGITTTTFAALPDVPVSAVEVNLPTGANSALSANGDLCAQPLFMPTTLTAQNGAVVKQNTRIVMSRCNVKVLSHRTSGTTAILTVQAPEGGRVSGSGSNLKTVYRHPRVRGKVTLRVPLSNGGVQALHRNRTLKINLRVGFIPRRKGPTSTARVTVTFRG